VSCASSCMRFSRCASAASPPWSSCVSLSLSCRGLCVPCMCGTAQELCSAKAAASEREFATDAAVPAAASINAMEAVGATFTKARRGCCCVRLAGDDNEEEVDLPEPLKEKCWQFCESFGRCGHLNFARESELFTSISTSKLAVSSSKKWCS